MLAFIGIKRKYNLNGSRGSSVSIVPGYGPDDQVIKV
jgi:hypothetical protein